MIAFRRIVRRSVAAALLVAAAFGPSFAQAQGWPTRPIRLIVGYPPGGAVDIIARLYGQGLSVRLGQPVVIENKPGTGGNLATDLVAKSAPTATRCCTAPRTCSSAIRTCTAPACRSIR